MSGIHPTALVDSGAQLAADVQVGAYSIIGPKVRIGAGTVIGPHCVIEGNTTFGERNRVFQFCSIGAAPQDKKYHGEDTKLVIGDDNTIREFCTLNLGTAQGGGVTSLGNRNWIMAYVHLAHDCIVHNDTIFANNAQLAGHVEVHDFAILGGFTVVHQFVRIGAHAITGMGSIVLQDVPPFMLAQGNTAVPYNINAEGLKRRGYSAERLAVLKRAYKTLYRSGLGLADASAAIAALEQDDPSSELDVALLTAFLNAAGRGIIRP
jgi:UDP-N-acetylglucosamine acyltransferase